MLVVYGWLKEKRPIGPPLSCYCYVCQRRSEWYLLRETEWVTFFGMRTIPFLSKNFLACSRCEDELSIVPSQARALLNGRDTDAAVAQIEKYQLSSKSEIQRNFLLSARASKGET